MNIGKYTTELSEYLIYKKYSECTINTYVSNVTLFLESFDCTVTKPSEISKKNIVCFLSKIQSPNTHKSYLSAIKLFYKKIINQPEKLNGIEQPKIYKKLPIVFTQKEVQKMFDVCENLKHKVILSLLYGCGLRRNELLNLKWSDVDKSAMILNIKQGKGKKDRQAETEQCIIPSVVGSTVWEATMQLRWIKHTEANEPRLGVRFANDIGWGWPDNIVLQQKWISDDGKEKWEDVQLYKQP